MPIQDAGSVSADSSLVGSRTPPSKNPNTPKLFLLPGGEGQDEGGLPSLRHHSSFATQRAKRIRCFYILICRSSSQSVSDGVLDGLICAG